MNKFKLLRFVYLVLLTVIDLWYFVASVIALLVLDLGFISSVSIVFCISLSRLIFVDFLSSSPKD